MNRPNTTPRSFSTDQLHAALGDVGRADEDMQLGVEGGVVGGVPGGVAGGVVGGLPDAPSFAAPAEARAVLRGKTRGYRHHPQLARFRSHPSPRLAIAAYLAAVHDEAASRGYAFDRRKIGPRRRVSAIAVTFFFALQMFEWNFLLTAFCSRR